MLLSEAKKILKKNGYRLTEAEGISSVEDLMSKVPVKEPENQLQKDALEIICAFYFTRDLPPNGMINWVKMDYNRFLQRGGDEKAARATRPCVVGASLVDNELANKISGEQKAKRAAEIEANRKAAEEKERLKREDPDAYYDKFIRNTTDDPSWRGPNGTWSLD